MKRSVAMQFLYLTFGITYLSWGACIGFSFMGFSLLTDYWLYPLYLLGGWSPTIASYIVLKKKGQVSGFKEWLANIFDFKNPTWMYMLMMFLALVYFIPQILIGEIMAIQPLYMLLILIPLMLFAGGLEEAGWRYVLQPELEVKMGYFLFSLIFSVIWLAWHLPLFFIAGAGQSTTDIGLYAIGIVGLSFSLGALMRISKSVFLCVFLHCLVNAGRNVIVFNDTFKGAIITAALLVFISVLAVRFYEDKIQKQQSQSS